MDYHRQNIKENVKCIMKWFWVYIKFNMLYMDRLTITYGEILYILKIYSYLKVSIHLLQLNKTSFQKDLEVFKLNICCE